MQFILATLAVPVTEATPPLLKHPRSGAASKLSEVAGHCPRLTKSTSEIGP
jgi:hypothetical protein